MRAIATLFAVATLVIPTLASAQEVIWSGTLRGELIATGNALGLDASGATTPGTGGAIGTFIANPKDHAAAVEGTFPTGTTADFNQNGSEAVLDLPTNATIASANVNVQVRLPNGVLVDMQGCQVQHAGRLIEALGRLRCSASTKG